MSKNYMSENKWYSVMIAMFLGLLLQSNTIHAKIYTVGGSIGWDFNVAGWENGKKFKAGDTLVFSYIAHNVVVVDKSSYDSCRVPPKAKTYDSGNDRITLRKGANYFICGFPGHCQSGMKIAAIAA